MSLKADKYLTAAQERRRYSKGSVTIEIAITALLFVIFAILAFDLLIVLWGYTVVDSAAKDAGRAAASAAWGRSGAVAPWQK